MSWVQFQADITASLMGDSDPMQRFVLLGLIFLSAGCASPAATPTEPPPVSQATPIPPTPVPESIQPTATAVSGLTLFTQPTATHTQIPPTLTPTPTNTPTATPWPVPEATIDAPGAVLPPGFSMIKFASMVRPTSLTFDENGRLFATSQDGTIHVFTDEDGDGRADNDILFSSGFNIPLGITIQNGDVYVSSNSKISILRDPDGDLVADEAVNFVSGLPVGLHQNDNLKFGPDGWLYMGVGSTCDVCEEADPRSATIMRFDPATREGEIYATGLRNPFDLAFHPVTGDLFATDNGRDDLGPDAPQVELNLIKQGADYGWPDCWDDGVGPGCEGTETAVAFFEAHSSADGLIFYTDDRFPPPYQIYDDETAVNAYVAVFGSWLKPEVETGIARVQLTFDGTGYQSQVSWFAQWPGGMPLGLTAGPDGAIYVGDFINDVIYRISYGS